MYERQKYKNVERIAWMSKKWLDFVTIYIIAENVSEMYQNVFFEEIVMFNKWL